MAKRKREVFEPSGDYKALFHGRSGNAINGLGETERRSPTPVFWHDPSLIALADLQQRIEHRYDTEPHLTAFYKRYGGRGSSKAAPMAPEPVRDTPESWAAQVKAVALAGEADLVGIARVDPGWVFEGYEVAEPWVVVLGVAMDHAELAKAPEIEAQVEVVTQYNRGTRAARAVANWIRARGYEAKPHGGPRAGPITLIPPALAAGFGELGKHGSIINRVHGSSFRLASVLTDMPLVADAVDDFGADDFCTHCQVCTAACPPAAIGPEKQTVRGDVKWYVDFDKCIAFFDETYGCSICIAVCPWSRPGVAPRLAEKMTRRRGNGEGER